MTLLSYRDRIEPLSPSVSLEVVRILPFRVLFDCTIKSKSVNPNTSHQKSMGVSEGLERGTKSIHSHLGTTIFNHFQIYVFFNKRYEHFFKNFISQRTKRLKIWNKNKENKIYHKRGNSLRNKVRGWVLTPTLNLYCLNSFFVVFRDIA